MLLEARRVVIVERWGLSGRERERSFWGAVEVPFLDVGVTFAW